MAAPTPGLTGLTGLSGLTGDRRLTLEHLRTLVTLADLGGFQRAGEALGRTQSAVTQSLRKLEEILDCRLVERRHGRYLGLTDQGRRFFDAARDILARAREAADAVGRPELSGLFRLGVPDDFPVADIHGVIARLLERNPGLRIETTSALSAHIRELFADRALDLALYKRVEPDDGPAGDGRDVRSEPLCWAARRPMRLDRFAVVPLAGFPPGCAYRRAAVRALEAAGMPFHFAYTSASYENVRAAVSAGLGIAALPASALAPDHAVPAEGHGFPALPMVRLTLAIRPDSPTARGFADLAFPSQFSS
ncbi:LysR family transcriptional regulator [Desulfovibrio sulfodismutans]|uniref:LysR family transcriptional regulator n=1 Tax=Desulfolutivibrio sulfodismutans TaxID=63561 RepID=A0A7K3NS44_9BACT|nr:LysR substrate-binding domain-containing protein [Desulfolutivibrio sulfodismutans]NDY58625.1 LysR family transcriptional regulator [Desulfolutivibrio sulfodismutans]QLA12476.1 LysR family transcriptional regulator [Desulfolutivibrio sulfodismutans DSM 3696]